MKHRAFLVVALSLAVLVASGCAGRKSSSAGTGDDTGTDTGADGSSDAGADGSSDDGADGSSGGDTKTPANTSSATETPTEPGTSSATQTEPGVTSTGGPDMYWAVLLPDPYGDPEDGMLVVRNQEFGCADWDDSPTCDPDRVTFKVTVRLESAQLAPGTYALTDVIVSTCSVTGPNEDANDCWGGGGSFEEGSLVVLDIDAAEMSFRFVDTMSFDFDVNDIDLVAERCP